MKGNTCLHLALRAKTVYVREWEDYLFALVYLIYKGANITAVNAAGITPSDMAGYSPTVIGSIPLSAWWRYILIKCKFFTRDDGAVFEQGAQGISRLIDAIDALTEDVQQAQI